MNHDVTRRQVLATTGTALATAVAGCGRTDTGSSTETATEAPTADSSTPTMTSEPTTARRTGTSDPRDVSFSTSAGTTIEATRYGAGDCGIVLVPQINMDRESWQPQATRLADTGLLVLAIDEGQQRVAAVRAAITYLQTTHSVENVILMGASTGGEAVVGAAATGPEVDGIVTLSAAGGTSHATDLPGRKLFVVSNRDEQRFVDVATTLHERASSPKELVRYSGSTHGQRLFESSHSQALWSEILDLIEQSCRT